MQCAEIQTLTGCRKDASGGSLGAVAIHYEYRHNAAGQVVLYKVRYTDEDGTPIALGAGETVSVGACVSPTVSIIGGGAQIAGTARAATPAFNGAPDTWDTGQVSDRLHSLTIAARSVIDGLVGLTANQIIIDMPDGTSIAMLNNETRTFSVARDVDGELKRDYRVRAAGRAYANITYTWFSV